MSHRSWLMTVLRRCFCMLIWRSVCLAIWNQFRTSSFQSCISMNESSEEREFVGLNWATSCLERTLATGGTGDTLGAGVEVPLDVLLAAWDTSSFLMARVDWDLISLRVIFSFLLASASICLILILFSASRAWSSSSTYLSFFFLRVWAEQ